MNKKILTIFLLPLLISCGNKTSESLSSDDSDKFSENIASETISEIESENIEDMELIHYIGRHTFINNHLYFAFSGSGFELKVQPTSSSFSLNFSLKSGLNGYNSQFINIYVDDELLRKEELNIGTKDVKIELEDDNLNSHYIKVIKLNEAAFSNLTLMDISLTNVTQVAYDKGRKGIMEFYGDSITCGYGILGKTSDGFSMDSEDATKTYAYLASEALGYEPSLVSQSGISLAMNVFDSNQYFKDIWLKKCS